ncbi:sensor histidine kinase [Brachybacterium hainanense]|uniref:Sensor histidine kinase n=1 Tax=Brachybacterium hainanense TaxID=1541174 RepID=A0ABV6RAK2_9MICO
MPTRTISLLDHLDGVLRATRRALPAISIALVLLLLAAPGAWHHPEPSTLVLWVLMSVAGGLSALHPVPASVALGGVLTLAVSLPSLYIGLGVFACLVAFASCVISCRPRTSLLIGLWYAALLVTATFSAATSVSDVLTGAGFWIVLLVITAIIAITIRVLGHRLGESSRRRVEDLAAQRQALARELHDTAIRATTEVVLIAEQARLRPELDRATDQDLARISVAARAAAEDLRAAMEALRRSEEDGEPEGDGGAVEARELLRLPQERLAEAGFKVNTDVEGTQLIPGPLAMTLSLCLGELVANTIRHGDKGQAVGLMLETAPGSIDVVLTNRRSTAASLVPRGGSGLVGVQERIAVVGGSVDTRGDGGSFMARLYAPLPKEDT